MALLSERLTQRERQIFDLLLKGLSNRAIASRLGISIKTVETHLSHIYRKLGVAGRIELCAQLRQQNPSGRLSSHEQHDER